MARLRPLAWLGGIAVSALVAFHQPAVAQSSELLGALLGGAGGAVAGAQFGKGKGQLAATAAGALAGVLVGQSAGRSLDRADSLYYGRAERRVTYYDPYPPSYRSTGYYRDHGWYGRPGYYSRRHAYYPPPRTVYVERPPVYVAAPPPPPVATERAYCREYTAPIVIGGREMQGYGQACMKPDGSWELGPLQPEQ